MGVVHGESLEDHPKCRPCACCSPSPQSAWQRTFPWMWNFPKALQRMFPAELKGTPLDMLLQPQPTTLPRAESAPSTLLSKPIPRQTSNGEFVTVLGLNMAADNNIPLQISYCCPKYNHCPSLQKIYILSQEK